MPIWLTILTSGITAAAVTGTMSLWIKRLEYRNHYYRKIIDKRLEIYEYLTNQVLDQLNRFGLIRNLNIDSLDGKQSHEFFTQGIERVQDFANKIVHVLENRIWLTEKLAKLLIDLHTKIVPALVAAYDSQRAERNQPEIVLGLSQYGVDSFNDLRDLQKRIENTVKNDFKKLHRVRIHLKEERALS